MRVLLATSEGWRHGRSYCAAIQRRIKLAAKHSNFVPIVQFKQALQRSDRIYAVPREAVISLRIDSSEAAG